MHSVNRLKKKKFPIFEKKIKNKNDPKIFYIISHFDIFVYLYFFI